jgi:hypothetical protein
LVRRLRKHKAALIAIAVYNFVLFFPVMFMGRALSPNDVYLNFSPWASARPPGTVVQNMLLNDPPTAYFTLMSLVKDDWRAFHWNPYVGAGIPGFGSSAAAILSPLILLPVLLVPLAWVYTAIVFLKLNVAFVFSYLWLREERLGKRGAAIGAIVIAGAGAYAVRWLWQITNATVLYPALLWIIRRGAGRSLLSRREAGVPLMALIALSFALAGFPAAMAYGAYVVAAYAIRVRPRNIVRGIVAVAIAVLIALPSLVPFVQLLRRSGYLELRRTTALQAVFPLEHLTSFVSADRLGNPVYKNWLGDPRLGVLNNYVETTIYLGAIALLLALLGVFNRRARTRFFWLGAAVLIVACMFGAPLIAPLVAKLPGFKYSALTRVGLLLPLAVGYLAAAGTPLLSFRASARNLAGGRRDSRARPSARSLATLGMTVQYALAIWIAFDLSLVAGRFHPFLEPKKALVPPTPMTAFLQAEQGPFRVAPFFDYLWPNSAELLRVEDIRSHFGSEADYRRLIQRLDPASWSGQSTVLFLDSRKFNYNDPLAGMLGIRWYIEHNPIDIVKWSIFGSTTPGVKETGTIDLKPGMLLERTVTIEAEPFWALELPVSLQEGPGQLEVTLIKGGEVLWSRRFSASEANLMSKIYVPLKPRVRYLDTVTLRVRSIGMRGYVLQGENAKAGESKLFFGRVLTPVIFERQLPDGRLFRNLAELPRFWPVSRLRKLNGDEFLAARDVDFESEAVITDDPVMPPTVGATDARVTLARYAPDEQRVITESSAPFYLASSEKLTPELRVTIDGEPAKPVETNLLFAGLVVPAGKHEVVFTRRIGRGWWWAPVVGVIALIVVSVAKRRGMRHEA